MTAPQTDTALAQVSAALLQSAAVTQAAKTAATNMITALWRQVNPYDRHQLREFAVQAGRIIVSSQRTVATSATASQLIQLRAVGIDRNIPVTIPDNVRGSAVTFGPKAATVHAAPKATVEYQEPVKATTDVPHPDPKVVEQTVTKSEAAPDKVFERAAETYRYQRSIGTDETVANTLAESRIADIVDGNLILAQRLAEQQTLAAVAVLDDRLVGYRRVIHPELSTGGVCGLCVAAASRQYNIKTLKPIHKRCKCSIAPITKDHDLGDLLNREDLDRLYAHAKETAPMETVHGYQRRALSTSAKALKRTRYILEHHNELGPVLTRVTGEKVPYYSVQPPAQAAA